MARHFFGPAAAATAPGEVLRRNVWLIATTRTARHKILGGDREMVGNEFDPSSRNMLITWSSDLPLLFHLPFRKGGFERVVLGLFASSVLFELGASMWPKVTRGWWIGVANYVSAYLNCSRVSPRREMRVSEKLAYVVDRCRPIGPCSKTFPGTVA